MKYSNLLTVALLSTFLSVGGCCPKPQSPAKLSDEQKKLSPDQRQLNYGYAIIYKAFNDLQWAKKILAVKLEADVIDRIVKDVNETSKKYEEKFEALQKDYPDLKIDDSGRPNILMMKNQAQGKDKMLSYFPVTGKKGADFERSLLQQLSGAMNEIKYLSQELSSMEPNEGLKKFLGAIHEDSKRLEDGMLKILNEKYYKDNTFKAQK